MFLSLLQKEQINCQNVVQVIKLKTENLTKTLNDSPTSPLTPSSTTTSTFKRDESSSEINTTTNPLKDSANPLNVLTGDVTDFVSLQAEDQQMTDEDVHLLWVDITNKVFHLKKNICESVEHWNYK